MARPSVLIGFERSGVLRRAFRAAGADAWSCDLEPADDGSLYHFKMPIHGALHRQWDLIIIHPVCTKLCVSGNHVYAEGKLRHVERLEAIQFTQDVWELCKRMAPRVAMENPVGVLSTCGLFPKPCYVQPYDFGEDASKKTGLYLHNLPPLAPTRRVAGRRVEWPRGSGKIVERWANQTDSGQNRLGPSETRSDERSKTYPGIADAMVATWMPLLGGSKCRATA